MSCQEENLLSGSLSLRTRNRHTAQGQTRQSVSLAAHHKTSSRRADLRHASLPVSASLSCVSESHMLVCVSPAAVPQLQDPLPTHPQDCAPQRPRAQDPVQGPETHHRHVLSSSSDSRVQPATCVAVTTLYVSTALLAASCCYWTWTFAILCQGLCDVTR